MKVFINPQIGDLVQVIISYKVTKYTRTATFGFGIYMGIGKYKSEWEDDSPKHLIFVQDRSEYVHYCKGEIYRAE